jgi:CotH kinase protein/Lamin Tail Domain
MRIFILALLCGTASFTLLAQSLPEQFHFSPDGHRLVTGGLNTTSGLYDSSLIRSVYLDFPQSNYWTLLTNNYATKTDLPATMTVDGEILDSVGVRFRGQTSYQMAQSSQKKSFDIDTDAFVEGQELMGYENLNLLNSFQDASNLRDVFFKHQIRQHVPAAKANFVHLYLNNEDWGIYPNVQQQNKDFLDEWFHSNNGALWRADAATSTGGGPGGGGPNWGDGKAAINWLGADTALYRTNYTLKSSDTDNPWAYLMHTCDVLNNTPAADLPTELPAVLDIDRTLWFLATEIAFSDDDSYIHKGKMDYYAYYEPETGRLIPLEYDGNSILATNDLTWGAFYNANKVNYPLLNKILAVPEWRQRYLAHLRTIIDDELNPDQANAVLDNFLLQIDALVEADPKKFATYSQFTAGVTALKNNVATRRTNLLANSEVQQQAPQIGTLNMLNSANAAWGAVAPNETASVTCQVSSGNGIAKVNLYFSAGLYGQFSVMEMFDDGQHNDGASADGLFGATLPGQNAYTWVRFYVEAMAANAALSAAYWPKGAEHDVFIYQTTADLNSGNSVVVNELMASNFSTVADAAGQFDDWIELFNPEPSPADLGGWHLSDDETKLDKYTFPGGAVVPANGYLVVWADEDNSQLGLHANFKLSAGGESVYLSNPALNVVQAIHFNQQTTDLGWARSPNGSGDFVQQAPTFNANNDNVSNIEAPMSASVTWQMTPNPSAGRVLLTTTTSRTLPVSWYNTLGVCVGSRVINGRLELDLSGQPAGMYWVKIGNEVKALMLR